MAALVGTMVEPGVSVDLSESVALDAGYRYRDIIDAGDDHSVLGGIRFKF